MKVEITDPEALAAVEPGAVRAYLGARGWHHVGAYGQHADVYGLDEAPKILAPASKDLRDYPRRIAEIVGILAAVEDRDASGVYRDLTTAGSDLVRVRAPDADEDGSVSLERGVALVSGARDLLLAAACASVRSASMFRSGAVREAVDYLRDVQLGQTERGSFVVTMLSPVPPDLAPRAPEHDLLGDALPFGTDVPFPRQATSKLVESLHALKEALVAIDRGADIDAFRERVPSGVSANLCEAVSGLAAAGGGVDVSLSWALTRAPEARHASSRGVAFSRHDAVTLREAAKEFRAREPRPGERLRGVVVRLGQETDSSTQHATLKTEVDGAPVSVNVTTSGTDRAAFIRAYDDRDEVVVEGELRRVGQRWTLRDPRNVVVLPSEPEDDGVDGGDLLERTN